MHNIDEFYFQNFTSAFRRYGRRYLSAVPAAFYMGILIIAVVRGLHEGFSLHQPEPTHAWKLVGASDEDVGQSGQHAADSGQPLLITAHCEAKSTPYASETLLEGPNHARCPGDISDHAVGDSK